MKKNNRLYQHLIILLALGNSSFALAGDNEIAKKDQAVMPAAPSGPYRSHIAGDKEKQVLAVPSLVQRPMQPMPAPQWTQRPPQPPMPAPNLNRNRMQPMLAPQWTQRPPQPPMPARTLYRSGMKDFR